MVHCMAPRSGANTLRMYSRPADRTGSPRAHRHALHAAENIMNSHQFYSVLHNLQTPQGGHTMQHPDLQLHSRRATANLRQTRPASSS